MKITKTQFLKVFLAVTFVLALVRCIFPSVAADRTVESPLTGNDSKIEHQDHNKDNLKVEEEKKKQKNSASVDKQDKSLTSASKFFNADGSVIKNKILSVPGYSKTFPDLQEVQYASAKKWGVSPVANREEAERKKSELVYVASNPYFHVDPLKSSVPYLVPRASNLLHEIGNNFFDSLQLKGVPLHKLIVTSVLRTKDDVAKLRGHNGNATENSCHLYGTTFDICYNRYKTVEAPGESRREVRNDTLKYILAEVLRDMREAGKCYIKYEVHQGCFHISVR
ncbi:hypothetical protein HMPREF1870_01372 [Bacteroidales bacterium KA00344]|nr:hypothetical protein HMPREF1870_01372 [Bacteroidales bacterium KA00344]